jgi:hypothetical protein
VKFAAAVITALGACLLAGCQPRLTLEEAQALCAKQGGLLTVIYTRRVTIAGAGPQEASPGNCISPSKFDLPSAARAPAK